MMVAVELVYDKDCPNVGEARASLRQALTEVGLPAEWTEWEASSPSTPAHGRRLGSPAILVDGRDVAWADPSDAACCRVYTVDGRSSGAPPAELITRVLLGATAQSRALRWRRRLLVVPAVVAALVPSLTCPACWPAYAGVLSALGLGFVPTAPHLLPVTLGLLALALGALALRAETPAPVLMGVVGSVLVVVGKFVVSSNPFNYTGVALLAGGSLWRARQRVTIPQSCPACAPPEPVRLGGGRAPHEGR